MPRGNDSVISAGTVGATSGEGNQWTDETGTLGNSDLETDYSIVISGKKIVVNGRTYETIEAFEEVLKNMDRTKKVTLVDDFAVSATYHRVRELVNQYGLICGESAE